MRLLLGILASSLLFLLVGCGDEDGFLLIVNESGGPLSGDVDGCAFELINGAEFQKTWNFGGGFNDDVSHEAQLNVDGPCVHATNVRIEVTKGDLTRHAVPANRGTVRIRNRSTSSIDIWVVENGDPSWGDPSSNGPLQPGWSQRYLRAPEILYDFRVREVGGGAEGFLRRISTSLCDTLTFDWPDDFPQ